MKRGRIKVPVLLGVLFVVDSGVGVLAYNDIGKMVGLCILLSTTFGIGFLVYFSRYGAGVQLQKHAETNENYE